MDYMAMMPGGNAAAAGLGATGGRGMGSLMDMFKQSNKNNAGSGIIGAVGNVAIGAATGNPIQVAMGLYGGVNEIIDGVKKRKAQKVAALQSMQSRMGQGW